MVAFKKPVALLGLASLVTALPVAPASPRSTNIDDVAETPQDADRVHILPVSTHRTSKRDDLDPEFVKDFNKAFGGDYNAFKRHVLDQWETVSKREITSEEYDHAFQTLYTRSEPDDEKAGEIEALKRSIIYWLPHAGLAAALPTDDVGLDAVQKRGEELMDQRSPVDMDALKRSIIYWLPKAGLVSALPADGGLDAVQKRGADDVEEAKRSIIYWLPKAGLVSALPTDDIAVQKRESDAEESKRSIIYWLPRPGLAAALPVDDVAGDIGATKRSDITAGHVERAVEDLLGRSEPDKAVRDNIKRNYFAWLHFGNQKLVANPALTDDAATTDVPVAKRSESEDEAVKRNYYAWLHFGNKKVVENPALTDDTTTTEVPVTARSESKQ